MNESYLSFFKFQFNRGRYFGDTLEEAFIPILLLGIPTGTVNATTTIVGRLSVIMAFGMAYISNWRTKFIIALFSLLGSIYIYKKNVVVYFSFFAMFIAVILVTKTTSITGINKFVIDRFFSNDDYVLSANKSRINYLNDAYIIGRSHLLTGVGLGNYYDFLNQKEKNNNKSSGYYTRGFVLIDDPHNMFFSTFASSGLVGLITLLLLLIAFLKKDIPRLLLSSSNPYVKAYICVFWSIFIYACFNPWLYFAYLGNFWLVRGIVDSLHKK